jgi:AcrR family transcriptional regulator
LAVVTGERTGRRPGPTTTRDEILVASRVLFAERGFAGTTVRAVAEAAGVHAALVHHHFHSKESLFVEALGTPVDYFEILVRKLDEAPRDEAADVLVRHFVSAWRDPESGPILRSLARSWFGGAAGPVMLREHIGSIVIPRLASTLGVPELHVAAAYTHLLGIVIADTVLGLEQLRAATEDQIAELVSPAIGRYLAVGEG